MQLAVSALKTEQQEEKQMSHDDINIILASLLQAGIM